MIWLTRMSLLDSAEDLKTPLLAQAAVESRDLVSFMLTGDTSGELFEIDPKSPVVRMWTGYEIAAAAYCAASTVELNRRGIGTGLHMEVAKLIAQLRQNEEAPFEQPPWLFDADILRSHRSNMARRWPFEYGRSWSGTPELWPYLWPFTDEDGSYSLFLSAHDKKLLASGERKLPKSIKERVENL